MSPSQRFEQPTPVQQPQPQPQPITKQYQEPVQAYQEPKVYQATSLPAVAQPPAYLRQQDDEEDEWAEDVEPIKILPTIAPLATYDEHEDSPPHPNHDLNSGYASNAEPYNNNGYQSRPSYESAQRNQIAMMEQLTASGFQRPDEQQQAQQLSHPTNGSALGHQEPSQSVRAIALYDYQANDTDEISFDPNDVITDIVQVRTRIFF